MKQNTTKMRNLSVYGAAFCLVYLAFQCFFELHYSIDAFNTYYAENQGALWQPQCGRYVYMLIVFLVDFLNLNLVTDNVLWVSIYMGVMTFAIGKLTLRLISYFSDHPVTYVMTFLIVSLSFVHVFMAEWFQFTEAILMYSISIFCSVSAALLLPPPLA